MNTTNQNERQLISRVIVEFRGKVLFIKRSQTDSRAGAWEIPGGAVDPGETFEEAAKREVSEETGLRLESLEFDHSSSYEFNGKKRISTIFRARVESTAVVLSSEHDDFKWVDSSNYHNLNLERHYLEYFDEYFGTDNGNANSTSNVEENTTKVTHPHRVIVYTDGGSRGNPGPSASGFVILDEHQQMLAEGGEYLGITTNNQAEYQAVRHALEACKTMGVRVVDFYMDSLLVANQMNGIFQIRNRDLWPIHENIKQLAKEFESVTFTHVRREHNKLADAKVNEILDNHTA